MLAVNGTARRPCYTRDYVLNCINLFRGKQYDWRCVLGTCVLGLALALASSGGLEST